MPPRIDHEKCNGCGKCIFMCGWEVFEFRADQDRVYPVRAKDCVDCFTCSDVCPKDAIIIRMPGR